MEQKTPDLTEQHRATGVDSPKELFKRANRALKPFAELYGKVMASRPGVTDKDIHNVRIPVRLLREAWDTYEEILDRGGHDV